ncbi:MAG: hypothetical protein NTW78_08270 [Campylobacterales bacterium]|nr:hypothetical protein [Campylobacterales bacterium]
MDTSELRFYLKTYLNKPHIDFKWSEEDNDKFFTYVNENLGEDFFLNNENLLIIKQAFKEYFEPVGYILFKLKDKQIRIKVFPYKIEPKESINLPAILKILSDHENWVEYDYKGNQNQISIPKKLKDEIYNFVNGIENEEINKKELVRFAVYSFFELKDNDIVIIKDEQIFIKILDDKKRRIVAEDEKETIANRYGGIDEEELQTFYDDYFSKQENKDFFYIVAKTFVGIYLLDNKIDNYHYEKNVFAYIQSILLEQLTTSFDHNEDFFKGFSGYIFRMHFKEVFGHIANLILSEIAVSNEYMINFLRYYSLGVIVLDGRKYKVPELETEGGLKWNVVSMLSIVKIYMKTKATIDKLRKEINEINKETQSLYIQNMPPAEYQSLLIKERERVTEELAQGVRTINKCTDLMYLTKDEEKRALLQEEIHATKEAMQAKREEKNILTTKSVKINIITRYNNLKNELDTKTRQFQREKKVLDQNEKSYLSIKYSLAKALVSKKVFID